jgi:hypothetical protein
MEEYPLLDSCLREIEFGRRASIINKLEYLSQHSPESKAKMYVGRCIIICAKNLSSRLAFRFRHMINRLQQPSQQIGDESGLVVLNRLEEAIANLTTEFRTHQNQVAWTLNEIAKQAGMDEEGNLEPGKARILRSASVDVGKLSSAQEECDTTDSCDDQNLVGPSFL